MAKCRRRTKSGGVLILIILLAVIVIPMLVMPTRFSIFMMDRDRAQNVIEGASLVAANDLSKIIINDPNFGFVSLSNYAPIGSATRAADGEPLPVVGINTLVGTLRQNTILARALGNATMGMLADSDRGKLQLTMRDLNMALSDSLCGAGNFTDIQGEQIDPYEDVANYLQANLPPNMQVESMELSNGWLSTGSTTAIPLPQPERLAAVEDEDRVGETYKAFTDIPVGRASFTFAGLDTKATIVGAGSFQDADNEHICSIVRLKVVISVKDPPFKPFGVKTASKLETVACAQPYSEADVSTNGVMTLRFSGGPIPGLMSWRDLLKTGVFRDNQITTYNVTGGDYPVEPEARVEKVEAESSMGSAQPSTSQQFSEHLYYWLRSGHLRPKLGDVLGMLAATFPSGANQVCAYEFADSGGISTRIISNDSVPTPVVSDQQSSTIADTCTAGGTYPVIVFRDNVKHLGTTLGGKHGGQPLAGYPLLTSLGTNDKELAARFGRRREYRKGLALDIEIGGTRQSTAQADIQSMRTRLSSRKI
jgi:hypothetical protein